MVVQAVWVDRLTLKPHLTHIITSKPNAVQVEVKNTRNFTISHYVLILEMLNSFLVGGFPFGFLGVLLILRKEETYTESCDCGSF